MTQATPSVSVSSTPIKTFERVITPSGVVVETSTPTRCQVFTFEHFTPPQPEAPPEHSTVGDLVRRWEQDETRRSALEEARGWIADNFYDEEGVTLRTLRLRKGWSQTQLAEALGTSQSHVARIERGTENLALETCRKLCRALELDMNTLDHALRAQEAVVQAKRP